MDSLSKALGFRRYDIGDFSFHDMMVDIMSYSPLAPRRQGAGPINKPQLNTTIHMPGEPAFMDSAMALGCGRFSRELPIISGQMILIYCSRWGYFAREAIYY